MDQKPIPEPASPDAECFTPSELDTAKQSLADEHAKAERYLANWQRAEADLANYQKRVDREKSELADYTRNSFLIGLLPVVDDFDFAVASLPPDLAGHKWVAGVLLIQRKFQALLDAHGVMPINALGQPFDPKYHEAVMHGDGEEGMVVQELRKGYMIKDAVVRPALVVVGSGRKTESKPEDAEEPKPGKHSRKKEKDSREVE